MRDLYNRIRSLQRSGGSTRLAPAPAAVEKALPDRLAALAGLPGVSLARDLAGKAAVRKKDRDAFLSSLGGGESSTRAGSFWLRLVVYPPSSLCYTVRDVDGSTLARLARDETLRALDPKTTVFIDTETTGLAGGTGTYAFLVGVGRFVDAGFAVTHYLMRDYDEEAALLNALLADLSSASALVSFNGKCFDIPLLSTRFRMNRCPPIVDCIPHFDLLFSARRLWRHRCKQCDLLNLESLLLDHVREIDVPSYLIPQIYFDFVRGVGIERMGQVLAHNAEDILSLVGLTAKACRFYRSPELEVEDPLDWFSLGKSFLGDGDHERARFFLERSLQYDLPSETRWAAQREYSLLLKRAGDYSRATTVWREMLDHESGFHPFPYEELAKYYEHVACNAERALDLVRQALARLEAFSRHSYDREAPPLRTELVRAELTHRFKRLMRKADTVNRGR
jgi:hypothetical protein